MVNKDFVTDFGGEFAQWNAYIGDVAQAGLEINLTIPAGTYQFGDITNPAQPLARQYGGGQRIHMQGAGIGSTILYSDAFASKWALSQYVDGLSGPQPRIATAYAGQTTVTLLDPGADLSKFSVGRYIQVLGCDPQGFGFPPNPIHFEFRLITATDGVATLTLEAPLVNTYKSTWPDFFQGSPTDQDCPGPATIIPMTVAWDADMSVSDCTISVNGGGWYGLARTETLTNIDFTAEPAIASIAISSRWINCTFHQLIEIDKGAEYLEYTNCTIPLIQIQSRSCATRMVMNDCTIGSVGTPQAAEFTNCDISAYFANLPGYGYSDSASFTNCWIDPSADFNLRNSFGTLVSTSIFSYDSGTGQLTVSYDDFLGGAGGPFRGMVPGATGTVFAMNTVQGFPTVSGPFFQILDYEQVGDNIILSTNLHLVDRLNRMASATTFGIHPCTSWTVNGGTGLLSSYDNVNGHGRPVGSYYYSNLSEFITQTANIGDGGAGFAPNSHLAGFITKVEIIVTKPYTGSLSSLHGGVVSVISNVFDADLNVLTYVPRVDLKVAGARAMTPGLTVGKQPTDDDADLGVDWYATLNWAVGVKTNDATTLAAFMAEDPSVWPEFSVEIFTDQEIEAPATVGF